MNPPKISDVNKRLQLIWAYILASDTGADDTVLNMFQDLVQDLASERDSLLDLVHGEGGK